MNDCVFCKIVEGVLPSEKVYENERVLAFKDINPAAPIHVLVVPKKHVKNLTQTNDSESELVNDVMMGVVEVAKKLGVGDAYKAVTNNGEKAGQVVPHFHFHVLAGWSSAEDIKSEVHKI